MAVRYLDVSSDENRIVFRREIDLKDGTTGVQVVSMLPETFSIRAGEYGLDPETESEAVWDMLFNEAHVEYEFSPLLTADTLEQARDEHLANCRKERDKLASRPRAKGATSRLEDETHVEVIDEIIAMCPVDAGLVSLARASIKSQVLRLKQEIPNPDKNRILKRAMIERLREHEDV